MSHPLQTLVADAITPAFPEHAVEHAGLRAEARLLPACAAVQGGVPDKKRVSTLISACRDWDFLIEKAVENRLIPQLFLTLQALEWRDVPEGARERLQSLFQANARHSLTLFQELLEISRLFAAEGIEVIAYKGPTLAIELYGNLSHRQTWDLDLLVREERLDEAVRLILRMGYVPEWSLARPEFPHRDDVDCELNFNHPRKNIHLELHWQVLPARHARDFEHQSVWDAPRSLSPGMPGLKLLNSETLFLVLCIHANEKHHWGRLRWILDIDRFVRARPEADWDQIAAAAGRMGIERGVALGIHLARVLLGTPVPAPMRPVLKRHPEIIDLAGLVRGRLFRRDMGLPGFREWLSYVRIHEAGDAATLSTPPGFLERLRYYRIVLMPEWQDRNSLPVLPRWCGFASVLMRPIRLFGRHKISLIKRTT